MSQSATRREQSSSANVSYEGFSIKSTEAIFISYHSQFSTSTEINFQEKFQLPFPLTKVESKVFITNNKMPPANSNFLNETGVIPVLNNKNTQEQQQQQQDNNNELIINRKPTKEENTEEDIPLIDQQFPVEIVWRNIALFIYLHTAAAIGLYQFVTFQPKWQTMLWCFAFMVMSGFGITAGCHRLWSHKSYKARLPLRLLLTLFQTWAVQNSIHEWSRDHRVHHKYSETNADPHNAKRGFFFAHMGWLCCKKHPAIKEKGKGIDMSDLEADPIIMFQKNYYIPLVLTLSFFLPALIPILFWGERVAIAWCFGVQLRYCSILHYTWFVNSWAHLFGDHPYDKNINPAQSKFVAIFALGEGWHNYHHTFPWDYKTSELGAYKYNWTSAFIDLMAKIGWAYDLKTVSHKVIMQRVKRTGDGTHAHHNCIQPEDVSAATEGGVHHGGPWGWGDKDIPEADAKATQTLHSDEIIESSSN